SPHSQADEFTVRELRAAARPERKAVTPGTLIGDLMGDWSNNNRGFSDSQPVPENLIAVDSPRSPQVDVSLDIRKAGKRGLSPCERSGSLDVLVLQTKRMAKLVSKGARGIGSHLVPVYSLHAQYEFIPAGRVGNHWY